MSVIGGKSHQHSLPSSGNDTQGTGSMSTVISLCPRGWPLLILTLCMMLGLGQSFPLMVNLGEQAGPMTYRYNGVVCFKCSAGTYVTRHCRENFTYSDCDPCPVGQYQSHHTQAESCGWCRDTCPGDHMVVVQTCSATYDLVCECGPGYFRDQMEGHEFMGHPVCKRHTECLPHQGLVRNGSALVDTECSNCTVDQYVNEVSGQCTDCTVCESNNMTQVTPCQPRSDTVCEADGALVPGYTSTETQLLDNSSKTDVGYLIMLILSVVGGLLASLAGIVTCLLCYRRRCTGERHIKISSFNDEESRRMLSPGINRSVSCDSSASASNIVNGISAFPELKDPEIWKEKVFDLLQRRLSADWPMFMRHLHGNPEFKKDLDPRIEQIKLDHPGNTQEQFYQALRYWSEANDDIIVKVDAILYAIERSRCGHIYDEMWTLCSQIAKAHRQNRCLATASV